MIRWSFCGKNINFEFPQGSEENEEFDEDEEEDESMDTVSYNAKT